MQSLFIVLLSFIILSVFGFFELHTFIFLGILAFIVSLYFIIHKHGKKSEQIRIQKIKEIEVKRIKEIEDKRIKEIEDKRIKEIEDKRIKEINYRNQVLGRINEITLRKIKRKKEINESEIEKQKKHKEIFKKQLILVKKNNDYILVENFAKKYENFIDNNINSVDELLIKEYNFFLLFQQKGYNFTRNDLVKLVFYEIQNQKYIKFRNRMFIEHPKCLNDYIRMYVKRFGWNEDGQINFLERLLKEENINFNSSASDLSLLIDSYIQKIELKKYEKKLKIEQTEIINIDSLNGYEFELFLSKLFKNMGFKVELTPQSGDQGVDLVLLMKGVKYIVQAKRYSQKVTNKAVQEVVAAMKLYNADRSFVVTTHYFTTSAIELGKSNNVIMINRDKLEQLIRKYY